MTPEPMQPQAEVSDPARRLDLRLLPAASAAWGSALLAVHSPWRSAAALGTGLAVGAGVLAGLLVLCHALARRRALARRHARGEDRLSAGSSAVEGTAGLPRSWQWAVHAVLVAIVAAAVLGTASMSQRHLEVTGWSEAISGERPLDVTFRVTGDAEVLDRPGFAGEDRVLARVRVLGADLPGGRGAVDPSTTSVVIASLPDGQSPTTFLTAGHRYSATVNAKPADPGQRTSALLFPTGSSAPQRLPADAVADVTEIFNSLRAATARAAEHTLGDAPGLLPGLILGDRSHQDESLSEAMRDAGLSHLTAVSGANCALVLGSLWGVARLIRLPRWTSLPIGLSGLVLFILLVHPEPSVIRAGVMGGIGALSLFAGRGRTALSLLCLCVLVLLIYDPWFSTAAAFQLSAAATLGIVLTGTPMKTWLERRLPAVVAGPLALACSAQLFVTPVLLPLSSTINTYAVPANLLAAPFVPLITVPGTLAAVLSTTLPWLSAAILWCSGLAAAGIGAIGRAAASLPRAAAPWPEGVWGAVLVVLYCAAVVVAVQMIVTATAEAPRKPRRWLRAGRMIVLGSAGGTLCALVVPATTIFSGPGLPDQWRIALCDVGQGDMLVVRTDDHAGIVVDTGEEPEPAAQCLESLEVREVPLLVVTHDHADHYGGNEGVIETARVEQVLYSGSASWDLAEEMDYLQDMPEPPPLRRAEPGERLDFAGGSVPVSVDVIAAARHHSNPNDNSLVALFSLSLEARESPLTLLTTGDLEETVTGSLIRRDAMPRDVDVLKVPHHGARNGGTALLRSADPEVALIGVGADNTYGHPAPEIAETLDDVGAVTYRTDQHGTVVLSADDHGGLSATAIP